MYRRAAVSRINILYLTIKGLRLNTSQQLGIYVSRFAAGGYSCHVATHKTLDDAAELARMGVGAHRVPGLRDWRRLSAVARRPVTLWQLTRLVRRHDIHLIHSFQTSSAPHALGLSRLTGVPHIVQFRNSYNTAGHYMRYKLHKAKVLLALSESMMEQYVRLVGVAARPDQRRVVIPNGIDVDAYRERGQAANVRAELHLPPDQPLIGVVGTLSSRKDPLLALEVAGRVLRERPDARIVFVGGFSDDGYRAQVLDRIREAKLEQACILAGYQEDPAPWFRAFDVLLHTAWREGHPKVFNEAMVFGKPIVAARIAGSRDVVEDGVTGYLCEPGDAGAFAKALLALVGSPARRMEFGEAGRRRVETRFSSARSLALLDELYRQTLGRPATAPQESRKTSLRV